MRQIGELEVLAAPEANISWPVKYRPKTFKGLVGQHEAGLLRHIVNDEQCPPVFMFSGPPGVGKTSAARIVAAALNCMYLEDKEPCGECIGCLAIIEGNRAYSVTEIDAASNGGAEDLRRIREQTFISTGSKKNVFIIDEAHSISWQGWNVLLKTLEEPNPDVYFILVTSEPSKVPLKIRTRALRFDFTKVPPAKIRERLLEVLGLESYPAEDSIVNQIVDEANGSMREAIKLLQQCIMSDYSIAKKDYSLELVEAIVYNDRPKAVEITQVWWDSVGDMRDIIEMLGNLLEKVYFVRHKLPVYSSAETRQRLEVIEDSITESTWAAMMEVLAEWSYRDGNKAHFTFLVTQLFKAVYGSSALKPVAATESKPADKPLDETEVEAMLQGL